ncbi:hypothetical protein ACFWB0_14365 [Rhodococcus sp. NPDC060086]|uniref:hypothetical protein n=1 Tax=Rhodococcus sp. NPDC060086 TaxID=3347055 RepID=UPI00365BB766
MGTVLLTEFRIAAPTGTIAVPLAEASPWVAHGDQYPGGYGRSCARPPGIRIGLGRPLLQVLATVLFTAVAVTAILCIAHLRASEVAADSARSIPAATDAPSPAWTRGAATGGR